VRWGRRVTDLHGNYVKMAEPPKDFNGGAAFLFVITSQKENDL
jgi:hypothetical protein